MRWSKFCNLKAEAYYSAYPFTIHYLMRSNTLLMNHPLHRESHHRLGQYPNYSTGLNSSFSFVIKTISTTYQKVKSFPQPTEKQYSSHNPPKIYASISFYKQKKGSPLPWSVMVPDCRNPLKQGFSAFHYVFFVIKTTVSTCDY